MRQSPGPRLMHESSVSTARWPNDQQRTIHTHQRNARLRKTLHDALQLPFIPYGIQTRLHEA